MIFNSNLLAAASGKLNGNVFAHNAGGRYIRTFVVPVNPNTSQQLAVRNFLASLQASFVALTVAQRQAWAVFAANMAITNAIGETIYASAQNWFIRCNLFRLQAGKAIVTAAPTIFDLAVLTTPVPTIAAAGTTVSLAFTNTDLWATAVGGYLMLYASKPMNGTRNFFAGPYRFAGVVNGAGTPPTSPSVITLPFVVGPVGSKMGFKCVASNADGRPSASLKFLVTCP